MNSTNATPGAPLPATTSSVGRRRPFPLVSGILSVFMIVSTACIPANTAGPTAAAQLRNEPFAATDQIAGPFDPINHIIVIYQENHGFDNYLATFPGADGIANAGAAAIQVDKAGNPYATLPPPLANAVDGRRDPHPRFPADLPNGPWLLNAFVSPNEETANVVHSFYRQQYQINGGAMDRFVVWSDAGGLTMGYWNLEGLPLYELAREFTLTDRFFQGAFGGSFLNHQWLICACAPRFPDAPPEMVAVPLPNDPDHFQDKQVTPDGYIVNHDGANPTYSVNTPRPSSAKPEQLAPSQLAPTIGDRLSAAGVDWAWYSGGWDDAIAGAPHPRFQYHHQPFAYYANYADGTPGRAQHLRDESEFLAALQNGTLPAVSFVKPIGLDNEHPGYTTVLRGQRHIAELVDAIRNSPYWADSLVVITYDENGGSWDHVAPPVVDRWGPGTRVPTVILSPFARRGHVDHTVYDTTSILRTIEARWNLEPLGSRDAAANDLRNALDLTARPVGQSAPAQRDR